MRVGVTLPQFSHDAEPAIAAARRAEAAGLDGVFVFDHLWPLARPDRPALHSLTLLGALTAEAERVTLGTLVARVGLLPDAVLVHALVTLHRMAVPARFIAALGTGDRANRPENEAYGVPYAPVAERVASVITCVRLLRQAGVRTWVGGLSAAVRRAAQEADAWNAWALPPAALAEAAAEMGRGLDVTWGGQVLLARTKAELDAKRERFGDRPGLVTGTVEDLAAHLRAVAEAGATWAVCAPIDVASDPVTIDLVAEAASDSLG